MRIGILPANGLGKRFKNIYDFKPLAPIKKDNIEDVMFIHSINNIGVNFDIIFVICHNKNVNFFNKFIGKSKFPIRVIPLSKETNGPLHTILSINKKLEKFNDYEALIFNCDQVLKWKGDKIIANLKTKGAEGIIPTITRLSNRHSYAEISKNERHRIIRVREKEVLSDRATIGLYWFKNMKIFLDAANKCFEANDVAPNKEFYVSHVYNYLKGKVYEVPIKKFWSLGEEENYKIYLKGGIQTD